MGVYGCIWVCMGALGHTNTYTQANNAIRDTNGLAGCDSRPCMAGKFHQKRHAYECRHKGVKEGLRKVGMGSDGCRGVD